MKEKPPIYAVIDTNVLVSALFSWNGSSNPSRVIGLVISGIITPLYNDEIIDEYRDVLSRDKFNFDTSLVDDLLTVFTDFGVRTIRIPSNEKYFPDPDDIVFYEISLSVDGSYLVTGNKRHFPDKHFVVTPAQMIEILVENGILDA